MRSLTTRSHQHEHWCLGGVLILQRHLEGHSLVVRMRSSLTRVEQSITYDTTTTTSRPSSSRSNNYYYCNYMRLQQQVVNNNYYYYH